MDFKKVTTLAAVATAIELLRFIIFTFVIQNIEEWYNIDAIGYINKASYLFFLVSLALFFTYLKLNQKKGTNE